MKKTILITTLLIAILGMNSCKDKTPEPMADINDLLGTWISIDSMTRRNWIEGGWVMSKDTLKFLISNGGRLHPDPYNQLTVAETGEIRHHHYKFDYFGNDSLHLNYLGPNYILITDTFKLKVNYSKNKDSITIEDFTKVYRARPFKVFTKL